jgi:adenylate cyclase
MSKQSRPLRITLASYITTLVVLVSFSILAISYISSARSLLTVSENMMSETSKGIFQKFSNLLRAAEDANEVIGLLISSGTLEPRNGHSIMDLAAVLLINNEGFSSVEIALANGSKYMSAREADGSLMRRSDLRTNTDVIQTFRYDNPDTQNRQSDNVKSLEQGYDARTRPWFKAAVKAGKMIWTDMYVSGMAKQLVYSCVMPIYDKDKNLLAVAAIDIKLVTLSKFLGTLKIFEHGKSFVLNVDDQAIAIPIKSDEELLQIFKLNPPGSREAYRLYDLNELPQPDIRTALLTSRSEVKRFVEFESESGVPHLANVVDFPFGTTMFKIGIIVPKSDLLGDISRNTRLMLLGVMLFLVFAVLIVFRMSKRISGSLAILSDEVDKVSRLELESDVVVDTKILEVARIDEAVMGMRRGLRSFKKYVPADLVRQLNTLKKEAVLGGERQNLTLFFSDIADFTAISEKLTPEELVEQLGVYFNGMSRIVLDNSGTLDKYIGDSIMAFWGAPVQQANHAWLACTTALKCQQYLSDLAIQSNARSHAVFNTRIGIHTGEAIVGNIGYEERMNYTVIGDAVNLASRLEMLNKFYGTKILISEDTFNLVSNDFIARRVDLVAVKGKSLGVPIYELIAAKGDLNSAQESFLKAYEHGMELYMARSWALAKDEFLKAKALSPDKDDYPCELLARRCEEFLLAPPGPQWSGVYVHETK